MNSSSLLTYVSRGREYGVRIFRLDDELRRSLGSFSPRVATLEARWLPRTLPDRDICSAESWIRRERMNFAPSPRRSRRWRTTISPRDRCASTQDALPKASAEQTGAAVLNASFLVAHDRIDEFRAAVTELVRAHERRGFRVEFTGPWPPYHFTRESTDVR